MEQVKEKLERSPKMGFWEEPKNGFLGRAQIKNFGGGGRRVNQRKEFVLSG